jgi:ribosome-associated toxin RatA of RatAB toxin-antitoxin module
MSSINKQVRVPYSAEQMFDLVYDINSYSQFIPLCTFAEVYDQVENKSKATIKMAKGDLGFKFSTLNTIEEGRSIAINLEHGPFKSLKGVWRFSPVSAHECIISLHFEFQFSNLLLDLALGGLFRQVCDSMIECFRQQAVIRYDICAN